MRACLRPSGGALVTLTFVVTSLAWSAPAAEATFPGSNGRIAYTWVRGPDGEEFSGPGFVGVVSVRPDGTGRRLIARKGAFPRYSPDGRRIGFIRHRGLWVARADGKGAHPVTPKGLLVEDFQWSPRGDRQAVTREFKTVSAGWLYTTRPDGSGLERLATSPAGIRLFAGAGLPTARRSSSSGSAIRAEPSCSRAWRTDRPPRRGHRADVVEAWVDRLRAAQSQGHLPSLRDPAVAGLQAGSLLRGPRPLRQRSEVVPGRRQTDVQPGDGSVERRALDGPLGRHDSDPDPRLCSPLPGVLTGRTLARVRCRATHRPVLSRLSGSLPDSSRRDRTHLLVRGGYAAAPDWQPRPHR